MKKLWEALYQKEMATTGAFNKAWYDYSDYMNIVN